MYFFITYDQGRTEGGRVGRDAPLLLKFFLNNHENLDYNS
jgi:hypothetical protein